MTARPPYKWHYTHTNGITGMYMSVADIYKCKYASHVSGEYTIPFLCSFSICVQTTSGMKMQRINEGQNAIGKKYIGNRKLTEYL